MKNTQKNRVRVNFLFSEEAHAVTNDLLKKCQENIFFRFTRTSLVEIAIMNLKGKSIKELKELHKKFVEKPAKR